MFSDKITKPIIETAYLNTDNTPRYRVIIRLMYQLYERIQYWVYPQEIFIKMKEDPRFDRYTLEECKRDFQALEGWKNVVAIQDTNQVKTLEEYKNKNFRYQLTEYTVEIERLTIRLENLEIEGSSLEPSLLEKIRQSMQEFASMMEATDEQLYFWWNSLNDQFIRLNQNYQDYIRTLNSAESEDLMKTTEFLVFKDAIVEYLRQFVRSLQHNKGIIEQWMNQIRDDQLENLFDRLVQYELSVPRLAQEPLDEELIRDKAEGRWQSMQRWFTGENSEANRVFDITNETIRKITRTATQISESYGFGVNRKDDYVVLAKMFGECETINDCHVLAAKAFGVKHPIHIRSEKDRQTESVSQSVYAENPIVIKVKSRKRMKAQRTRQSSIESTYEEQQAIIHAMLKQQEEEAKIMAAYMTNRQLKVENLPRITPRVRQIILRWLSKSLENLQTSSSTQLKTNIVTTEFGQKYYVMNTDLSKRVLVECEDGRFEMPAFEFYFLEDVG
ncbi:TIGR02677 family protein [Fundicoccus culcitae]|uniref:TIGR02677 family protein n=1 Tax=Fundicoccus culcitae TaxID=2969821 RepID=A0ABY5P351_9LACT|nr:TIGR02677 family protein [Fundicoccus culcitae]UUX33161.1 TIGR02677 family protein [Fundicoccus culcitae]